MFKIAISPTIVMITIIVILITTMVNECWNVENLGMFGTLAASGSFVLITTHLQHENQSATMMTMMTIIVDVDVYDDDSCG